MPSFKVALIAVILVACNSDEDTKPGERPQGTPPQGETTQQLCEQACANMQDILCPEHDANYGGKTCEENCLDENDVDDRPFLECLAEAESCEELRACKENH